MTNRVAFLLLKRSSRVVWLGRSYIYIRGCRFICCDFQLDSQVVCKTVFVGTVSILDVNILDVFLPHSEWKARRILKWRFVTMFRDSFQQHRNFCKKQWNKISVKGVTHAWLYSSKYRLFSLTLYLLLLTHFNNNVWKICINSPAYGRRKFIADVS